jgi:protein SCO1/2
VFIAAVLGMFVYSVTSVPQLSDEELRSQGVFLLPRPRDIAEFNLTDHRGEPFSNEQLMDQWTFMFFGFTHCPDVCPTTMSVLGQVDTRLRQEGVEQAHPFQGVLVSVDPERDTPEQLGPYATAFSPRFVGVTGDRAGLAELAQQLNVAFAKVPNGNGGYTMDHTGNIVIINPMGHYHGFIKMPHKEETIRLAYQSLAARL